MSVAVRGVATRLFGTCERDRASGIVSATLGRLRRLFCLEDGLLVHAASNLVEEQIDAWLVDRGLLDAGRREAVLRDAAAADVGVEEYLAAEGGADPAHVRDAVEDHARMLLCTSVDAPGTDYRFERGRPKLVGRTKVSLSCVRVIVDHARRHPERIDDVRLRIGPPTMRVRRADDADRILAGAQLDGGHKRILEHTAKDATELVALLDLEPAAAEETLRATYALLAVGALEAEEAAAVRRAEADGQPTRDETLARIEMARTADHYAVLGIARNASREEIREAYYVLARRFHPDRFRSTPLERMLDRVEEFFSRVTESYNTLYDPLLRRAYDQELESVKVEEKKPEQDAAYLARQNFARARALLGRNRYQEAVVFLENAVQLDSKNADYRIELGRVLARNPRRREDAVAQLEAGIRCNPAVADGYIELGLLFRRMGRLEEAEAQLREALRWDPNSADARRELREMGLKD